MGLLLFDAMRLWLHADRQEVLCCLPSSTAFLQRMHPVALQKGATCHRFSHTTRLSIAQMMPAAVGTLPALA